VTTIRNLAMTAALVLASPAHAAAEPSPLTLDRSIPLAGEGRIDHLATDETHRKVFVAELGAGAVEAVDVASGRPDGRITGLKEPQGLGYLPQGNQLAVASGGDGTLRFYDASTLAPVAVLKLGDDADDVRVDPASGRIFVGYGHALAVVDGRRHVVLAHVDLPAHPEGFEVDGDRVYVNLPNAGGLAVIDLAAGKIAARWANHVAAFNFPLALNRDAKVLATVYRLPAKLALIDLGGRLVQADSTCGDADDAFFDKSAARLYVVCGAGSVDAFGAEGQEYRRLGRVPTRDGARTGLFSAPLHRLFVAAPARGQHPAALLLYRTTP
jgi:hypothetical protein